MAAPICFEVLQVNLLWISAAGLELDEGKLSVENCGESWIEPELSEFDAIGPLAGGRSLSVELFYSVSRIDICRGSLFDTELYIKLFL